MGCAVETDNAAMIVCGSLQGPCRRGQERDKGGAGENFEILGVAVGSGRVWVPSTVAWCSLGELCGGALVSFFGGDDLAFGKVICDRFCDGAIVHDTATDVPVNESEYQDGDEIDTGIVHLRAC